MEVLNEFDLEDMRPDSPSASPAALSDEQMLAAFNSADSVIDGLHEVLRRAAPSEDKRDSERLDWLIDRQAWIQWTVRDGSIRQCQVYDQDEDEEYHILSGDDRYFDTPRAAIDAAIAKGEGK
jgi:hypothetical protein